APRNRSLTAKQLQTAGPRPRIPRKLRRGMLVPRCLVEVARRGLRPSLVSKSAHTVCPRPKQRARSWCDILVPPRPPEAISRRLTPSHIEPPNTGTQRLLAILGNNQSLRATVIQLPALGLLDQPLSPPIVGLGSRLANVSSIKTKSH